MTAVDPETLARRQQRAPASGENEEPNGENEEPQPPDPEHAAPGNPGSAPAGSEPVQGCREGKADAGAGEADATAAEPTQDEPAPCDDNEYRHGPANQRQGVRVLREWLVIGLTTLVLALLIRTFLVQAFFIPSGSMIPTLQIGDRVIVDKVGYRMKDVKRGEVIVFYKPDPYYDIHELIKRVVAVGGETFELQDGIVYIDGRPLEEPYLPHDTLTLPKEPIPECGNAEPVRDYCEVPEGKILVLGDNRESSRDGRYYGPVDVDTVIGRAFLRVWPPNRIGTV